RRPGTTTGGAALHSKVVGYTASAPRRPPRGGAMRAAPTERLMSEHVRVAVEDGVMRLTLARAEKKNALTNAMYDALADALQRADDDPAVRVVLFDAEGETFCAGNDLGDFTAVAAGSMPAE